LHFVESVASGIEDGTAAAKKQCQILYPEPFASSLESPNLKQSLEEKFEKREQLESSLRFCRFLPPNFDNKSFNLQEQSLEMGVSDLPFAELVKLGIECQPVAAKKQCRIIYPEPFALSSELPNSEPELAEKFEEWGSLESLLRICCRLQSMFEGDFPQAELYFGCNAQNEFEAESEVANKLCSVLALISKISICTWRAHNFEFPLPKRPSAFSAHVNS